jgi:hypothetical protein
VSQGHEPSSEWTWLPCPSHPGHFGPPPGSFWGQNSTNERDFDRFERVSWPRSALWAARGDGGSGRVEDTNPAHAAPPQNPLALDLPPPPAREGRRELVERQGAPDTRSTGCSSAQRSYRSWPSPPEAGLRLTRYLDSHQTNAPRTPHAPLQNACMLPTGGVPSTQRPPQAQRRPAKRRHIQNHPTHGLGASPTRPWLR